MTTDQYVQRFVRLRSATTREWYCAPELRPRLVADAKAQDTNLTEMAMQILSKRLGYVYAPNGRRTEPGKAEEILNLRVPVDLDDLIAAAYPRLTRPKAIIRILSTHYGLGLPVPRKQTRSRRGSPVAKVV
jgi:hypothetical protein